MILPDHAWPNLLWCTMTLLMYLGGKSSFPASCSHLCSSTISLFPSCPLLLLKLDSLLCFGCFTSLCITHALHLFALRLTAITILYGAVKETDYNLVPANIRLIGCSDAHDIQCTHSSERNAAARPRNCYPCGLTSNERAVISSKSYARVHGLTVAPPNVREALLLHLLRKLLDGVRRYVPHPAGFNLLIYMNTLPSTEAACRLQSAGLGCMRLR